VEKARLMGQGNSLTISLGISCYPKHAAYAMNSLKKPTSAFIMQKNRAETVTLSGIQK